MGLIYLLLFVLCLLYFSDFIVFVASLPNDIGDAKKDEDYNISDEEWISDSKGVVESAAISNVLMNLSSTYASDDEGNIFL